MFLLVQEAQRLGDEFLSLEKYVNLNYLVRLFSSIPCTDCWSVAEFAFVLLPCHSLDHVCAAFHSCLIAHFSSYKFDSTVSINYFCLTPVTLELMPSP